MKLYIVNWQGPYNDETLRDNPDSLGLYLITGFQKHERNKSIQYCGITKSLVRNRIINGHHKKDKITREREYWIGKVISTTKVNRRDLEIIESLIVYFWKPELNDRKKYRCPSPTVVLSRWHNRKGELRLKVRYEGQRLQDVIYWDGEHWHLSNSLKRFDDD